MYKDIISIVDEGISKNWTKAQLRNELSKYLSTTNATKKYKDKVLDVYTKMSEYVKQKTEIDFDKVKESVNNLSGQFSKIKGIANKQITDAVMKNYGKLDRSNLVKEIKHIFGTQEYKAKTVARTATKGVSAAIAIDKAVKNGIENFKFVGPPPDRSFCKAHLGKTYTLAEIKEMSNGQGLDVLTFKGGWNCRHKWLEVVK